MGWWRDGGRGRGGRREVGSFGMFVLGYWLAVSWGPAWGCSSRLRYSTGRGWSLKSELGEVMGGEGVRFSGGGGNGRGCMNRRKPPPTQLRAVSCVEGAVSEAATSRQDVSPDAPPRTASDVPGGGRQSLTGMPEMSETPARLARR